MKKRKPAPKRRQEARTSHWLNRHFAGLQFTDLVTTARRFPVTLRVDLQLVFDEATAANGGGTVLGVHHGAMGFHTLTMSALVQKGHLGQEPTVGPLQYDDVDVGETVPARCVYSALWLHHQNKIPCAVLVVPVFERGRHVGVQMEIAVPAGMEGKGVADDLFRTFEQKLAGGRSYAGKVLSLEAADNYSGKTGSVRVHRLRPVTRDELILPAATVELLERNLVRFAAQRPELTRVGLPLKKGVLLYGPPGTGKTHTIHYLSGRLPDHTTLIISAEQVVDLSDYLQLARYLQPAIIVLEDVDLIARQRTQMRSGCEESLLNKLLNEMDGLREDAAMFFILTTNAPEQLEAALASRPGRVDQAIEFPLPDEPSRAKLARLYGAGLKLTDELVREIARRTERASASFIKELMRRTQQFALERNAPVALVDMEGALHEMVMAGGSLNRKLLGLAEA